jgi:murein DD-endopeptidase MepM/ murein hydrolase activator NlpD
MPPPHREPTTGAAARPRLAALMLVAGVILALGPASAALAERVARAAEADGPGRAPAPQPSDPGPMVGAAWAPGRVPPLRMPLTGPVVRGFDATGTYGPGHRGVDVGGQVGEVVRAPAGGRVQFSGPVAGVRWVTLLVAPGVAVTVGPLLGAEVSAGQRVQVLAPIGRLGPGHGMMLHLGLRVDGSYVDPLPYLLDRPRPRLAPLPSSGLASPDPPGPVRLGPGPSHGGP